MVHMLQISPKSYMPPAMLVSAEVVVAAVGVLITVPTAAVVLWNLYRKRGQTS